MIKAVIDLSALKNEVNQIKEEAFKSLSTKTDNERREALSKVVERLKTLQGRLSEEATKVEVK